MKKIIIILIIGIAIGVVFKDILQTIYYKKVESYEVIGKLVITKDFINVRTQPTTTAEKVFQVIKDEKYDYVEMFKEDLGVYTWYKIIFSDRRVGWIASYNEESWVEVK